MPLTFIRHLKTSFQVLVVVFLLLSLKGSARGAISNRLDEVLMHLEANLRGFDSAIPDFFCSEQAVSQYISPTVNRITQIDSTFRVKRTDEGHTQLSFVESRQIISVNGHQVGTRDVDEPITVAGMFEGGLAIVSLSQEHCMRYTLGKDKHLGSKDYYVVEFVTLDAVTAHEDCILREKSNGYALIEKLSLHINTITINTPHHLLRSDDKSTSPNSGRAPLFGRRTVMVQYSPVSLDRSTFWLPTVIHTRIITGENGFHPMTWSFEGNYSDYHKLEVTSQILPAKP